MVLACRSQALCNEGLEALRASAGAEAAARASTLVVDLGSVASCTAAGERFVARGAALNVLVNNAGVMATQGTTRDGLEVQMGTNHVGHAALTRALMPALRAGAPARVVNVSSVGHWIFTPPGGILLDDFRGEGAKAVVNPWSRYASSKLANVLHAFEINRRFGGAANNGVVGVALHPGNIISTRLGDRAFGSVSTILTMLSYGFPLVAPIFDRSSRSLPRASSAPLHPSRPGLATAACGRAATTRTRPWPRFASAPSLRTQSSRRACGTRRRRSLSRFRRRPTKPQ